MQIQYQDEPIIIDDSEIVDSPLSFQKLTAKFFALWPWLILSAIIGTGCAYFYLKQTAPEYKVHASILVQDDKKGTEFGDAGLLQDFGLLSGKSNVDNEAEILKSRKIMEQVVERMQLYTSYTIPDRLKSEEIYETRPVDLRFVPSADANMFQPIACILKLNKTDINAFALMKEGKKVVAHFGDTLRYPEGAICVTRGKGFVNWQKDQELAITVDQFDAATQNYLGALSVDIPNKQVSVIYLTITTTLPGKGETMLNTLLEFYLQSNVDDKNRIADSTMKFIDDRLVLVTQELTGIEKDIEGFKTTNKLTDLSEQSKAMIQNTSEYARQQTTNEVALSVVQGLEDFLKDNQNNTRVVPSSLVMQDPSFQSIIQKYNETQLLRDKLMMSLTAAHPSVVSADEQLRNVKLELFSSINSIKKGIEVSISELKKRSAGFEKEMSKVPANERIFLDISRQQAIKQELYLFLLKKREETAVSKSSTIANARIIDSAKSEGAPFKPKKIMVLLAGLMAGILLPFGISLGKDAMSSRIAEMKDITNSTRVPILAEIGHNNQDKILVVEHKSRDLIAEQFRSLRTNLQFLLTGKNDKTIMITSSMGGEGKSFLSVNLAMVLALAGKKVILLELDLRKPKITAGLNLKKEGFTNYIISQETDWAKWIQLSGVNELFHVLASGSIPPNPTELLMLPKTKELLADLKNHYDYVLIDTPPAGMVTDAEIIAPNADITLYMVRHQVTYKQQIQLIERFFRKKSLTRINIIVNDVLFKKAGYGYGYGNYGYGYGYGNYGKELSA